MSGWPPAWPTWSRPDRPGVGGTRPLPLEVRLDLLLGPFGELGFCQPDGSFLTTLAEVRCWLAEIWPRAGEAVLLDGLGARVQALVERAVGHLASVWCCAAGGEGVVFDAAQRGAQVGYHLLRPDPWHPGIRGR